jgi:hypothetical protein
MNTIKNPGQRAATEPNKKSVSGKLTFVVFHFF